MPVVHDIIHEFPQSLAKGEAFGFSSELSDAMMISQDIPDGTQITAECDIVSGSDVSICSDEGGFFCTLMENAIPTSLDLSKCLPLAEARADFIVEVELFNEPEDFDEICLGGWLQPMDIWNNPYDVDLWQLPVDASESVFLASGYTKTTAKLNGVQLYAPNHQLEGFINEEMAALWREMHPSPAIVDHVHDFDIPRPTLTQARYSLENGQPDLKLIDRQWQCCCCGTVLKGQEIKVWGYRTPPFSEKSKIYCAPCLGTIQSDAEKHQEYTWVSKSGSVMYYHPYHDAFAISYPGNRATSVPRQVGYERAIPWLESRGVEFWSWLPWWQRPLRQLMDQWAGYRQEAKRQRDMWAGIGTPCPYYVWELKEGGQSYFLKSQTPSEGHRRHVSYLIKAAMLYAELDPRKAKNTLLSAVEIMYLLEHYYGVLPQPDVRMVNYVIDLDESGSFDADFSSIFKWYYRPGLLQALIQILQTGEIPTWSLRQDAVLGGDALVVQLKGEQLEEDAHAVSSRP